MTHPSGDNKPQGTTRRQPDQQIESTLCRSFRLYVPCPQAQRLKISSHHQQVAQYLGRSAAITEIYRQRSLLRQSVALANPGTDMARSDANGHISRRLGMT